MYGNIIVTDAGIQEVINAVPVRSALITSSMPASVTIMLAYILLISTL